MPTPDLTLRTATAEEVPLLAALNLELIRDERHRNPMDEAQLADRMRTWLDDEYEATIFERGGEVVGYALYREDTDAIYLRQLFIVRHCRRQGLGRRAVELLTHDWKRRKPRLRLEVLSHNHAAIAFWHTLGFHDYAITMELTL